MKNFNQVTNLLFLTNFKETSCWFESCEGPWCSDDCDRDNCGCEDLCSCEDNCGCDDNCGCEDLCSCEDNCGREAYD